MSVSARHCVFSALTKAVQLPACVAASKPTHPHTTLPPSVCFRFAACIHNTKKCTSVFDTSHPLPTPPPPGSPSPAPPPLLRPGELIAEEAHCLCLMAQAEAAALTAFRAAAKGSSASVVASLQAGAADLFEKAAKVVREYTGESS